jgi:Binding-protein-dependent transport system inner membrane component.
MKKLDKSRPFQTAYGVLIIAVFWQGLHMALDTPAVPSPYETVKNLMEIFPDILLRHLLISLLRVSAGLILSIMVGGAVGLWLGMNRKWDRFLSPVIYILYPIPKIAFLPVLMVLFGLGETPKIVLIIIIIIFQIIMAVRDGVRDIPKEYFYSVRSLGLSGTGIYRHLVIPAVLPRLFSVLRISTGISIFVLFFAENFATTYGIGYFIMDSWIKVNYVDMYSGILALGLFGLVLYRLVDWLERRLCPWMDKGVRPQE